MQKLTRLNSLVGHLIFISTDKAQWQRTMFLSCFQVWPWTIGMWPPLELQAENMHMADAIARVSFGILRTTKQQLEKYPHKRNSIVFCASLRDVAISVHPLTVILIGLIKEKKKNNSCSEWCPAIWIIKKKQSKQAKNVWSSLNPLGSFWKQKGDCEDSWIQK